MTQENLRPDAPAAMPRIPGYRIEGVLGRGATGVVYGAVQIAVDRPVAIKILHPELTGNRRAVRRLQREARTAARLGHPGIISAIDMGEVEGRWWYAMELVEGINLAERIGERGAMSEREALRVFAPLVDALQHASEMGVVHRDIKPGNVLIDPTGRARLVDLGLAFAEDDPRMTRSGGTLGTPHYISPEQARDPGQADVRSDIWSLGATLYHALVGHPPFEGQSVAEILSSVLYQPIGDPRREAPHLSKGMALVLRKCLSRDPDRRYQTPADLGADLERLRERRAPTVRKSSLEPVADGRPAWIAPAAWTLLIVGAAAGGYLLREAARDAAPQEGGPARSAVLEGLLPSLEDGRMDLSQAFRRHAFLVSGDASAPLPAELRPEADRVRLTLEGRLEQTLDELTLQVTRAFDQDLEAGDLRTARTRIERDLEMRLQEATGFATLAELPVDGARRRMTAYAGTLDVRLNRARVEAVDDAVSALRLFYRESVATRAFDHVEEARFRDAHALLDGSPEDWSQALDIDLGRFESADRMAIVRDVGLLNEIARDVAEVDRSWEGLDGRLRAFVGEQERLLEARLEAGESGTAKALDVAWSNRVLELGLRAEQLPSGSVWRSERAYQESRANLVQREAELTDATARNLFIEDQARADALCAARRYEEARAMWDELLASSWRGAVRRGMESRRLEADLLSGFLDRAVVGVRALEDQRVTFEIDGIVRRGIAGGMVDPGLRPFDLREGRGGRILRLALRDTEFTARATVLGAPDVERLAGSEDPLGLADDERLALALFRFHEGDVLGAKAVLPTRLDDPVRSEVLFSLHSRIEATLQRDVAAEMQRRDELARLMMRIALDVEDGQASPESLGSTINSVLTEFYDLLSDDERASLLARKDRLLRDAPKLSVEQAYPGAQVQRDGRGKLESVFWTFESSTQGWKPGSWRQDLGALELTQGLESQAALLDQRTAAVVALGSVLSTEDKMTLTVRFDLDESAPPVSDLIVTAGGLAFLFVDEAENPRMLVGAGPWSELLAKARKGGELTTSDYGGFLRTQANELRIEFGPRNRSNEKRRQVDVWLNGEELTVRLESGPNALPMEPRWLGFRSYQPMRLLDVRFEGREVDR